MTSLWTLLQRDFYLRPQKSLLSCFKVENFAVRSSQQCIRSHSIFIRPYQLENCFCGRPRFNTLDKVRAFQFIIRPRRNYVTQKTPIITHFKDLPPDYEDDNGLAYRHENLTLAETKAIFGDIIDTGTADRVLRGIHGRRVAGTLEEPLYNNTFEKIIIQKALAWLRENVPVDEELNKSLRAETELLEIENELVTDAERIGLYKPNTGTRKDIYGTSAFDKIREANIQKREAEEALKEEKKSQVDEIVQNNGTLEIPPAKVKLERREEHPWLKYYRERANVLPDKPPDMSTWQRLWPSGLLVVGIVTTSLVFSQVYTPPKKNARLFPEMPISAATVIGIIVANSTIFCMWRVPMLWRVLNKYFITYPGYPRALSLLGSFWSHQTISHLALNMTLLYFIGTRLHEEIGRANFLALYFSAGTMSGFFSLACWVFMKNFSSSSIGASGAVMAIITAFLLRNNGEKIKFFGNFPPDAWPSISALFLLGVLMSYDLIALARFHKSGRGLTVDHYGHIGGYISGALWTYSLSSRSKRNS